MNKYKSLIFLILFLLCSTPLLAIEYEWYTQSFPWVGEEGEDPEVVFADLIENDKLISVSYMDFQIFWYDPCDGWQNAIGKIRNDCEYKIKVRKDVIPKRIFEKTEIQPYRDPTVIIVDTTGTGDYTTIQEGINAAVNGDTVLVHPGTYYENINYNGKNITVASLYITNQNNSYIHSTIIDGNQNGSVVLLENGETSDAILYGFTIQNGSGTPYGSSVCGGGIFIKSSAGTISHCIFKENTAIMGGGISCYYSNVYLEGVTIYNNHAYGPGGGISLVESDIEFNNCYRCNIYMNYAGFGSDIEIFNTPDITVFVDTFTVLEPDSYYAYSRGPGNFTFDILHNKIIQVNHDLYVNPDGNDNNSGLTPEEPLKTIAYALNLITSDSLNPNRIYLASGTYSPSLTDEKYGLNCKEYVNIIGEDEEITILDGDELSKLIVAYNDNHFSIENLTIRNGNSRTGGGIKLIDYSSPIIKNVTLRDNFAESGTHIFLCDHCNPIFENVTINGSSYVNSACIRILNRSNPVFINCVIEDNHNIDVGAGAIDCLSSYSPIFINTKIVNNSDDYTSGIGFLFGSTEESPVLINCTICNNGPSLWGTISQSHNTNVSFINCILWNYDQNEIYFSSQGDSNTVTILYTDIKDSISGIYTNNNGTINWLEGNIDSIPQFVGGDPFSYQLTEGSPCIDAGTPDTTGLNLPPYDLAGQPRIYNGRIDIGAYEWQGQGIDEPDTSFIHKLYLFQNKPNPFSSSTTITFISADYERIQDYKLTIYNARGQLIRTYNGRKHNFWIKTDIVWDGTDKEGNKVSPGVYFYKLIYGDKSVTKKMILIP